jgi:hypothetical protein
MAEQGDLDELARRYLDLWQDQMTALANDPEMAEATEQMLRLMGFAPPDAETSAHAGTGNGNPWAAAQAWQQTMQAGAMAGAQTGAQAAGQQAGAAWGWPMAMMTALAQGAQQMPGGWPGAGGMPPGWPPQGWGGPGYPGGPPPGWGQPPGAAWPGAGWTPPYPGGYAGAAPGPHAGWGPPPGGHPGWGPPPGWGHPGNAQPGWAPPHGATTDPTGEPTGAGQTGTPGAQGSANERQGDRGDVAGPHERARPDGSGPAGERPGGERSERDDGHRQAGAHAGGANGAARPAPGAEAPARTSGGGDLDMDQLASRLARLEERLAALEGTGRRGQPGDDGQSTGGKAGKSAPRNRKRGS